MPLDSETRSAIENLLEQNPVVLFMKGTPQQPQCGFSAKSIAALDLMVPDFATINVLEHNAIREGIKEYGNWPTIPQLYIKGELIGGCDIIEDMLKSGELADALGIQAPATEKPSISISSEGVEVITQAIESQPDAKLHLQISATFTHKMSLDPSTEGAVQVDVDGLTFHLDPWSATRADGLKLVLEEDLTGTKFIFDNPNAPPPVRQMTVQELKSKRESDSSLLLIDVREDEERARGVIEGSKQWNEETRGLVNALPKDSEIVLHCESGGRSQALGEALRQRGYTNVSNVVGGISAWADEIDPDLTVN